MSSKKTKKKYIFSREQIKNVFIQRVKESNLYLDKNEYILKFITFIKNEEIPYGNIFFMKDYPSIIIPVGDLDIPQQISFCNNLSNLSSLIEDANKILKIKKENETEKKININAKIIPDMYFKGISLQNDLNVFLDAQKDSTDLWIKTTYDINYMYAKKEKYYKEILTNLEEFITNLSVEDKEIIKIFMQYNKNYYITVTPKEDSQDVKNKFCYYYFTEKGLQKIDTFITKSTLFFNEDYKIIASDTIIFKEHGELFIKKAQENQELFIKKAQENQVLLLTDTKTNRKKNTKSNPVNTSRTLVLYKILTGAINFIISSGNEKEIIKIIKICLTIIYNHSKSAKEKNENVNIEDAIIENNITWIHLPANYTSVAESLGELILTITINKDNHELVKKEVEEYKTPEEFTKEYFKNKTYLKDFLIIIKYICDNIEITDEEFLNIYEYFKLLLDREIIICTENTEANIKKMKTFIEMDKHLNPKKTRDILITMARLKYCFFITKDLISTNFQKSRDIMLFKIIKNYINNIIKIYNIEIGYNVIELLVESKILKTKLKTSSNKSNVSQKTPRNIYVNENFYMSTAQAHAFPSFGYEPIIIEELQRDIPKHNRFLLPFYETKVKTLLNHSNKFTIENLEDNFIAMLDENRKDASSLNINLLNTFIENLTEIFKVWITCNIENNYDKLYEIIKTVPQIFNYLIPKEMNLHYFMLYEDYQAKISMYNSKFEFIVHKILELYTLGNFPYSSSIYKALKTIHTEWLRIFYVLPITSSFGYFYQKVWVDARLRQYPEESVFNVNKSQKFRSFINHPTVDKNTLNPEELLLKNTAHIIEINNSLDGRIKKNIKKIVMQKNNYLRKISKNSSRFLNINK